MSKIKYLIQQKFFSDQFVSQLYLFIFSLMLLFLVSSVAQAKFTYEGHLLNANDTPVVGTVNLKFQIKTVTSPNCVLFEEVHTTTADAEGYFSVVVGAGTASGGITPTLSFSQIFSNSSSFSMTNPSCTVTPVTGEGRLLHVYAAPNPSTPEDMGTVTIYPSILSDVANKVGIYEPQHLLRVESSPGVPATAPLITPTQATELTNLINGSSIQYMKSGSGAAKLPLFSGTPGTPVAGNIWYDSTTNQVKYYNGSTTEILSTGGGGLASGSVGTTELANDAVTSTKISDGSILPVDLLAGSLGALTCSIGQTPKHNGSGWICETPTAPSTSPNPSTVAQRDASGKLFASNFEGGKFTGITGSAASPSVTVGSLTTGLFSPGGDDLSISNNGTETFRFSQNGRLGIGITIPQSLIHATSGATASKIYLDFTGSGGTPSSFVGRTSGPGFGPNSSGNNLALFGGAGAQLSSVFAPGPTGFMTVVAEGTFSGSSQPTSLRFFTTPNASITPAERLTITSDGNVGLGTSTPTHRLTVNGNIAPEADGVTDLGAMGRKFNNIYLVNAPTVTSDRRRKKEIQDLNLGIEFISKLNPVSYKWKSGSDNQLHYGLIAQETDEIIQQELGSQSVGGGSSLVIYDEKSDSFGIRYSELIAPIIKAVQELYNQFLDQQEEVNHLRAQNEELKLQSDLMKSYLCGKDPEATFCEK